MITFDTGSKVLSRQAEKVYLFKHLAFRIQEVKCVIII